MLYSQTIVLALRFYEGLFYFTKDLVSYEKVTILRGMKKIRFYKYASFGLMAVFSLLVIFLGKEENDFAFICFCIFLCTYWIISSIEAK